ncbi:hypothetical protein KW787_00260 [Candidatus Pacearchaeota archaeon]|nr:hypothetical protein [Candidatus Pacearchaeota archaeon]
MYHPEEYFKVHFRGPLCKTALDINPRTPILAFNNDSEQSDNPLLLLPRDYKMNYSDYLHLDVDTAAWIHELPLSGKLEFRYVGSKFRLSEMLNMSHIPTPLFGYGGTIKLTHDPRRAYNSTDDSSNIVYVPTEILTGRRAINGLKKMSEKYSLHPAA